MNVSNPNIEPIEKVMVWASMNLMPSFLGALVLSGVVAAALSSATTFLSLVGFNLSNDILRRSVKTDNSALRYSRLMMFATSMVALIVCLSAEPQIFWLTYFAGTLFAATALMAWLVLPLSEIRDEAGLAAWFSLEALFAYSWIPLFALCSYLVIYGTGRSYVSRLKMKKP